MTTVGNVKIAPPENIALLLHPHVDVPWSFAKKNVECTSIRKETERKTENQVENPRKRDMESVVLKEENVLDWTKSKNIYYKNADLED